jgi:tetratricopeptide (TPR) repeat protein
VTGPALSERDLTVIRSYARRIDPFDAGANNNLGVLYYQKGLTADAISCFLRALELDPRMQVAKDNLEIAYHSTGYYDRRVAELRDRLRRDPTDRDARWELGRTYASLGHFHDAITEFESLLARHPDDVAALLQYGLALRGLGDLERATEAFEKARAIDPESPVILFYFGEALYNRGLNEPARAALEEAVSRNPDHADAYYLLAFVYGDMGDHERAKAATKKATALNPTFARAQSNLSLSRYRGLRTSQPTQAPRPSVSEGGALAHFNLGLAFRQKGYYVEALREYKLATDAGEDSRLVRQAMAEVHLLRRDVSAALELYEALVAEDPESPKLWNERGVCMQQSGRRADAIASYESAVAIDPEYGLAWNNLGVISTHDPEDEQALDAFHRALRVRPDLVVARLNLALALFHRRRLQLALEAYRQVLEAHPTNAVAWNGVGLVLVELRRFEDARNAFARAVDSDPDHASAHYNLSFTLSNLGDFDGALRATKRALELDPFYVAQKYVLTIDLQYENQEIAVPPEISADVATDMAGEDFAFDTRLLDRIFDELQPPSRVPAPLPADDPLALASDFVSKGLLELATAHIERAIQRGAPRARASTLMGQVFARRGLHGEALERFREALEEESGDPEATLGEVQSLLALGRGGEAAQHVEELVALLPNDVEALVSAARVRLEGQSPETASELLKRAQQLAPGRADLFQLQARVCIKLGDVDGAVEASQVALQLDNSLAQVWHDLGRLEETRQNWVAAKAAYQRALDLLPTLMESALALADLVRRSESPAGAVQILVDILMAEPWDLDALLLLGRCLLDDGRPERASEALRRLLKFDTDNDAALFHLGVALARLRRYGEAVQAWERVVQVDATGPFAQAARSHGRSARDLQHIFAAGAA